MAVDVYGCTIDDVDKLVVWDVRTSTDPTPEMVEDWIEEGALELQGQVGGLAVDDACGGEGRRGRARRIVALYAAAMAEDAHYPERALGEGNAGDYGARLYDRWEKRFEQLVADIEACRAGVDASGPSGGAGHSFPRCPLIRRDAGV